MTDRPADSKPKPKWKTAVRVVLVLDDTEAGPIPILVSRLTTRLQRMGCQLVVCCLQRYGSHSEKIQSTDTAVVALDVAGSGLYSAITGSLRIREILTRFKPDILHAMGTRSRWLAPLAALGTDVQVVVREQDEQAVARGFWGPIVRGWSRLAGRVNRRLIGRRGNERRMRRYALSSGSDVVLKQAVDSAALRGRPDLDDERLKDGHFLIGVSLKNGQSNRARMILDAFQAVAAGREDCRLVVWGDGSGSGLRSWVVDRGLDEKVLFFPTQAEPAELVRTLDVLWEPGESELDRIVILTGLTLGIPVVCSHETDLKEGIEAVGGALMRDPAWPLQFASATRDLMQDAELMASLKAAGPKLMDRSHRFHAFSLALRQLYDELALERQASSG